MKRTPLSIGSTIQAKGGSSYTYIIDRVIGDGASSIVYEAHYIDNTYGRHDVRLRECYPYASDIQRIGTELVWADDETAMNDKVAFITAYHKLLDFQNTTKLRNSTAHIFDLCQANGTIYSVMDVNEGQTFEQDNSEKLSDILKTILALARVVEKYHNNDYLHLDIKPSNFLVIPETRELVILFDVDSVTAMDDIASGKIKCVPYSKGWAAPEQMQGRIDKLCPATDIYSIGAILFQKVMGRAVENEDIGIFADWNFDGELFDDVNPTIKRLLREIFKKTLAANIKRRYQSANELISALDEARKVAEQEVYLVNEDIFSEITFVGREKDLANMHDLFSNGTKAIFLHGFGGVGKTALARRFAELYASDYDCVQFHRYTKDLATIIDDYMVNVDSDNPQSHRKQLKKICDNTKALIIIDNFDVEDDEDLEYLLSLNVNLIFTTRNDYTQYITSEKIQIVELESLPTEELVSVFKNEYGKHISEEEEALIEEIIEKFGNLTILVPIIAKQILASRISIEEFAESIEDDAFARFAEDSEDIRIRKDGKSQRTNSLNFIRAMFNIAGLSEEHKKVLRYLDLLKYHRRLTIKEYRRLTGENSLNVLNDLQRRNWISYVENIGDNEETEIKVHQLIYDLVEKDEKPTYQNVPGITSYIEKCFGIIEEIIHEEQDSEESGIDFEKASCITYALLIYDDIRMSEAEESRNEKMGLLYGFMNSAFLIDADKTYKLFFESPKESTYYFYVHGIMDWYDFVDTYFKSKKALQNQIQILQKAGLSFELDDGTKIDFSSIQEKEEYLACIEEEQNQQALNLFKNSIMNISYFVLAYYFYSKAEYYETANAYINLITIAENQIAEEDLSVEYGELDESNFLLYRLEWYLQICQSPRQKNNVVAADVNKHYDFYRIVFGLLLKAIQGDILEQNQNTCLAKAEELMILLEQSNERFASFGLSSADIMSYTPPTAQEREKNLSLHWSKKANVWYESVEKVLANVESPYQAYSQLLAYEYQTKCISNSKVKKLLSAQIVDRIVADPRLTLDEKKNLLINQTIEQIPHVNVQGSIKKKPRKLAKKLPKAELYFDAISKVDLLIPDWRDKDFDFQNVEIIDAALTLRRLLKKEWFDIDSYIESQIVPGNILYVGDLLYLIEKLRKNGLIKKSQYFKNKLLNLCLEVDLSNIPEEAIQMILYKIRPLAVNYKRDDVIAVIDSIDLTVERKYHLALLDWPLHEIAFKLSDQKAILKRFLDDYINVVAKESYYKIHEKTYLSDTILDEMELALHKYHGDILTIALATSESYYETIISKNSAYGKTAAEGYVRSLSPFWISEFHCSCNPIVDIGVCYLIAQTYDSKPFSTALGSALETIIDDDKSENDYQLSQEEIQTVLNNIVAICPKAKEEIDAYLKKYPLK